MALLFMDSFDHYATADINEKWPSTVGTIAISAANGRRSSACLRLAQSLNTVLKGLTSSSSTIIIGTAFKSSALGSGPARIIGVYDASIASSDHIQIRINLDGSISVYRGPGAVSIPNVVSGTVLLGTSAGGVVATGIYAFIEVKIVIHDTTGSVVVRVDGTTVLTLINQDTSAGGTAWTSIWLGAGSITAGNWDFDDVYVCDGSGSAPYNDFLGDCRVDARFSTGAGATTGFTPSAGSNWSNVDDTAPNDDTDYNAATTIGLTDTFVVQDAPVVGATLYGIQHNLSVKKADTGAASVAPVIRHSGTNNPGSNINPGTSYAYGLQIATEIAPGVPITEANFNAAEFGYRKTV